MKKVLMTDLLAHDPNSIAIAGAMLNNQMGSLLGQGIFNADGKSLGHMYSTCLSHLTELDR